MKATEDGPSELAAWWLAYLSGSRPKAVKANPRLLRSVDLFSGAGGLALGWRQAADECGFATKSVIAVDHDPNALAVYRRNHQTDITLSESVSMLVDYQIHGSGDDATFFSTPTAAKKLAHLKDSIDVVLAGPPCQGHSNLNNHSRRDDDRNELYLTVPAMAVALNIPMVIIENVPGVVHDHRSVVSTTIALLKASGYSITCGILAAADMGWPQTRKRFFVVATKGHSPINLDSVGASLSVEHPLSVSWAIDGLSPRDSDSHLDIRPSISAENQRRIDYLFSNGLYELPNSERPECHQEGTTYKSVYGRMRADKPAPTLTAGFLSPGRGRFTHPTEPRSLTPREAARIQAFPETFDFRLGDGGEPNRTDLARWIGNAVPMPLGYAAGISALLPLSTNS